MLGVPDTTGPDQYPLPADHPRAKQHSQISGLLDESPAYIEATDELMRGRQLLRLEPEAAAPMLLAALEREAHVRHGPPSPGRRSHGPRLRNLIGHLAGRAAIADEGTMIAVLDLGAELPAPTKRGLGPRPSQFLSALLTHLDRAGLDGDALASRPTLREGAETLYEALERHASVDWQAVAGCKQLRELLSADADQLLASGERWADALLAELAAMGEAERQAWTALIVHCREASKSKPSKRWLRDAATLLGRIGEPSAAARLARWLPLVSKGRSEPLPGHARGYGVSDDPGYIIDDSQVVLRGLAWAASGIPDAALARALAALTRASFRKLRGHGPRAPKVGNAALWALGEMASLDAVAQLVVLEARLGGKSVRKRVAKALASAAAREGVSREELDELAVPTHDLREVGRSIEVFGDYWAELEVVDSVTVRLRWREGSSAKLQVSVPAAVKREFPDELEALRAKVKDISALLSTRRDRLELRYRHDERWTYASWRERYLDHPLVGSIARRLIWRVSEGQREVDLLWRDGQLRDLGGGVEPKWISPDSEVRLWHPLTEEPDAVLVWRDLVESAGITQPFKQAHRERYRLDADERDADHSLRFDGHILRQHQFHALCQARGWTNQLRLCVDQNYGPATLALPRHGLRAELWIEGIIGRFDDDTSDKGTFLYVISEQLRFHRIDDPPSSAHAVTTGYRQSSAPLALAEVPARVLSEVLRDVDLFVSVSSVANDPSWAPSVGDGPLAHYWDDFAFGPLSATGRTRRDALAKLVPRTSLAGRCELGERFVEVEGADGRRYAIHIGTGNVRGPDGDMVVPAKRSKKSEPLALPFEGDATLGAIVTKALALCEGAEK